MGWCRGTYIHLCFMGGSKCQGLLGPVREGTCLALRLRKTSLRCGISMSVPSRELVALKREALAWDGMLCPASSGHAMSCLNLDSFPADA